MGIVTAERLKIFIRYRELLYQLVMRDIKLKYRRSYLGYLWSVLNPLLLMCVVSAVFSQMFSRNIPNFPAYLICGQIMYNFMGDATREAMASILGNAALLKKIYVPKYIFTVSRVTSTLVTTFFSFVALFVVLVFTGVPLRPTAFLCFVPVLQVYIFSIGIGLFLAQAAVFFRDIQYIYSVVLMAWMYLTPIFYNIEILPDWLFPIVKYFNPMYNYVTQLRLILLSGQVPPISMILTGLAWGGIALIFGIWAFLLSKDKLILFI